MAQRTTGGTTDTLRALGAGMSLAAAALLGLVACGDGRSPDSDGAVPVGDGAPPVSDPLRVAWTRLEVAAGPVARPRPAMAALGDDVVLFGGGPPRRGEQLGDTWVLSGGAWRQVDVTPAPPARTEAMMVPFEGRLLLFGGLGTGADDRLAVFADTWAFDGERWEELAVRVAPEVRGAGAAPIAGGVVAYGGLDDDLARSVSTYVFDGADWTARALDPSPPPVRDTAMAGDGTHGYFTGGSAPAPIAAVWRFDGATWTRVGAMPTGRAYHAAGMLAGRLIVFGGVESGTTSIARTAGWPGPIEPVGPEPDPSADYTMATRSADLVMWGDDPAQLWTLTVAE